MDFDKVDYIKEFENIIKDLISPLAKSDGFRKQGFNFYKNVNDITIVFNFQKSQWNTKDDCSFYINTGVFSSFLHDVFTERKLPKIPKEYDCQIRLRIEELNKRNPNEYKVSNKKELDQMKAILPNDYKKWIFPYLSKFQSSKDMIKNFKETLPSDYRYLCNMRYLLALYKDKKENYNTILQKMKKHKDFTDDFINMLR